MTARGRSRSGSGGFRQTNAALGLRSSDRASSGGASAAPPPLPVRIDRVGADGDGIAAMPDGTPVYLPLTLPGEDVVARPLARHGEGWLASADMVMHASPARVTPPCVHFGTCGGCVLQHWRADEYLAWKTGLLDSALRQAGFPDPAVTPIVPNAPRERRRMDLAARRLPVGMRVGLHRLRAADVVDLTECHVLHPVLFALIAPLRAVLTRMQAVRREASVAANLLESGADILLRTDAALTQTDRDALIAFAAAHAVPRITWAQGGDSPEPIGVLRPATMVLQGVTVRPPSGGFLQATSAGEAAIVHAVLAGLPERLPPRARIADLYSGSGTITFALAKRARVAAWDGDAAAVAALRAAAGSSGLNGKVEAARRDLVRQPLMAKELAGLAAVVLDPPHAGAAHQMAHIAAAKVPVVIYVSCNPGALARDARLLRDAGYRLERATPIDQFLWSSRLESVCVFRLPSVRV
jgi:23S rRNA (uracil1939-C5)-methyltransferase